MSSREPISELNQRARVPPGCLVARRGRWTAHSRIVSRQPSSHRIDGTSARRLVLPRKIGKRALLRRNWLQWRPPAPGPMGWDRRRHADAFERPEFHLVSRSLLIRAPDTSAGTSDKPAKKSSSDRFFSLCRCVRVPPGCSIARRGRWTARTRVVAHPPSCGPV